MRVLAVDIEFGPHAGGASVRNHQVCRALLDRGVDVRLMLLQSEAEPAALRSHAFPPERLIEIPQWNRRFRIARPDWRRIAAEVARADVLYLPSYLWGAAPLAWLAARRYRKPWVICPAGLLPFFGRSLLLKRLCQALFGRSMLRHAAALVAISKPERAHLIRYAADAGRVVHIPNGVAYAPAACAADRGRQAAPGPDGRPHVLFIGRLDPVKGLDLLLQAYATLPRHQRDRLQLLVAGDGPLRTALERQASELGLARDVRFLGWVEGATKHCLLRTASFIAIPSRRDAMTLVVLEAAMAARPVLLTRECGFADVAMVDGGHEVDATAAALADGLQQMLSRSDQWDEMGGRLRQMATDRFTWDRVAESYEALFEQVANGA